MMAKIIQMDKKVIVNKVHIPINITVGRRKKHCLKDKSEPISLVQQPSVEMALQPLQDATANEVLSSSEGLHGCTECGRSFSSSTNLYRHVRSIHKAETFYPKAKMKCCLCDYECLSRKVFDGHVTAVHGVSLLMEEFRFAAFEDFEAWKVAVEQDTSSSFIKKSGTRKTKTFEQVNYYCHRSGSFRPTMAERKRKLKARGSCKINSTCPSRMMVTTNAEGVRVVFHKTHVGHEFDLGHLRLSYEQRKAIADKLAADVPFEDVLSVFRSNELGRAQLLTRRDLLNIRREFGIGARAVGGNEASDEDVWVKGSAETADDYPPIIFYVTQESPSHELQLEEAEVHIGEPCESICSGDSVEEAKNKLRVKAESLIDGCATVEDCQTLHQLLTNNAVLLLEKHAEPSQKTVPKEDSVLAVLT